MALYTCIAVLLSMLVAVTGASLCPELSLAIPEDLATAQALNCKTYLYDTVGIPTLFLDADTLTETFPACMELKELAPSLDTTKRYNCTCMSGFSDELGELGFLRNLQHKDLRYITCGMSCPAAYENVMHVSHPEACSCVNKQGCVFQPRVFGAKLTSSNKVLVLPDDLRMEAVMIECSQRVTRQEVASRDVIACALNGMEYVYLEECPAECSSVNYDCRIEADSQRCTVMCAPGYFRVVTDAGRLQCKAILTCAAHHYHNYTRSRVGNIVIDSCVACSIGSENEFGDGEMCRACGSGKTNTMSAAACESCPRNSLVISVGRWQRLLALYSSTCTRGLFACAVRFWDIDTSTFCVFYGDFVAIYRIARGVYTMCVFVQNKRDFAHFGYFIWILRTFMQIAGHLHLAYFHAKNRESVRHVT